MPTVANRWSKIRDAFGHAFAVEREPLTTAQVELVERLAEEASRRRLGPLVAAGAELLRPVAGVTGHSVTFFEPLLAALVPPEKVTAARELLQHPDAIDLFQKRLSEFDRDASESRPERHS